MCAGRSVHLVLLWVQAGLFSAVTSAFIADVQEGIQPDYQKNELPPPRDCRRCLARECSNRHRCCFRSIGWPDPAVAHVQPSFTQVSLSSPSLRLLSFLARNASIVTLRLRCIDPLWTTTMQDEQNGYMALRPHHEMSTPHASNRSTLPNHLFFISKFAASIITVFAPSLPHRFRLYPFLQLPVPNSVLPHSLLLDSVRRRTQEVPQEN